MQADTFGIYCGGKYCAEDDLFFLRQYDRFGTLPAGTFRYTYQAPGAPALAALRRKYKLEERAGNEDDLRRISNIRQWIYSYFSRREEIAPFNTLLACETLPSWNADDMMERGESPSFKADCATWAAVLTEMLLALGYKARWIQCLPLDLRHDESHCITHVYVPSLKKWIVADAAQNLFYFSRKGVPMNLYEMRDALVRGENIYIFTRENKTEGRQSLLRYWVKNIFRFRTIADSAYGFLTARPQTNVYLNPLRYEIVDKPSASPEKAAHLHTSCAGEFFEI